jgi:citrate lyase subunit beta/citryl-CoA lyase
MLAKAPGLGADMVFVDLEDAVAPGEKVAARTTAAAAIRDQDFGDAVVGVRVNAWDSEWTVGDLAAVVPATGGRLDVVVMPKVSTAAEVVALDLVLTQLEIGAGLARGAIGLEVQIETARGVLEAASIAAASPRVETLILGPGDLAASLEMPVLSGGVEIDEYPGDHWHHVYVTLLLAARANGLQVIDGPYFRVKDLDGLRAYGQRARVLGFDGKWALHPDQIPVINELFSPTQAQVDRAGALLAAYDAATTGDGRGAVLFEGEMIDEASRKMAVKVAARGERAGLRPTRG